MPFPAGVHDQFNLMISFEGVCELLHTSMGRFRFLVASPPVRDLLLSAKDLFIAAMVDSSGNQDHYLYLGVGSAPSRLLITRSYSTCRPGSCGGEHNKIARPPRGGSGVPISVIPRRAGATPKFGHRVRGSGSGAVAGAIGLKEQMFGAE